MARNAWRNLQLQYKTMRNREKTVKKLRDKKKAVLDVKRAELCIVYSTDSTPKVTEVPLRIC